MLTSFLGRTLREPVTLRATVALFSLALLLSAPALAQPGAGAVLTGTVSDADGPLPGATVWLPALERGAASGADGRFRIADLPADTVTVTVRFVGYASQTQLVDLASGEATLDVTLAPEAALLGDVLVTVDPAQEALRRDPRAVAVLDGAELDALRGQTLGETLAELNGVTTLTTGPTISKPVVRGLHSDRVLILENGVRQEGQQWGGEHAPEIDPFAAGRIEVIKGAAGVEYGAGAIGGVVRLDDEDLPETGSLASGVGGRLMLQGYSNSGQGAGSLALEGAPEALPGFAWRLRGSARRAGDARTPNFVMRNSAFAEASGHLTLGYTRGPLEIDGHLSRFTTQLGIYRGAHFGNATNLQAIIERGGPDPDWDYQFSYDIDLPRQSVTHDVARLHGHTTFGAGHHVDVQYAVQNNRRQEYDAHGRNVDRDNPEPAFDLSLLTQSLDVKVEPQVSPRARLVVGAQARTQANRNGESGFLVPNFRAYDGGLFAHGSYAASGDLTLDAGLRLDARTQEAFPFNRTTREFSRQRRSFLGGAAVVSGLYAITDTWSIASNLGSAWRPPNISELYSFGVHHGTAQFEIGDPNLGIERSLDASATLRHEGAWASGEFNAYLNHVFGYVYALEDPEPRVTIRGTFPSFEYTSADARLAGIDANVEVRPLAWLGLGAKASILRADNLDLGGPLYGVPSDRFGGHARLNAGTLFGLREAFAEVDVEHVTRQDRVQPGAFLAAPYPDPYTLTGLRLGGELSWAGAPLRVQLSVENAFDVSYRDALGRFRYFIDEPGRNVTLRVAVPLG